MNLDKRIKSINDIQSVLNSTKDSEGKVGYLAKSIRDFKDLSKCKYGTVDMYREDDECFCHEMRFTNGVTDITWYSYFIPEDDLLPKEPEKKYRAYTADEFIDKFEFWIGRVIRVRDKKSEYARTQYEYKTVFTGYRQCIGGIEVFLNGKWYTMHTLLGSFEYMENNEWKPFGVIDEDKE